MYALFPLLFTCSHLDKRRIYFFFSPTAVSHQESFVLTTHLSVQPTFTLIFVFLKSKRRSELKALFNNSQTTLSLNKLVFCVKM